MHPVRSVSRAGKEWIDVQMLIRQALQRGVCTRYSGNGREGVHPEYVREIAETSNLIVYKQSDKHAGLAGFLLAKFQRDKLYISVVCSNERGVGRLLVHEAFRIGRGKKMERAALHALPHVLEYYPRFGFERRSRWNNSEEDGYYMEKNLKNKGNWRPHVHTPPQLDRSYQISRHLR